MRTSRKAAEGSPRQRRIEGHGPRWTRLAMVALLGVALAACSGSNDRAGPAGAEGAAPGSVPGNPTKQQAAKAQAELANSYTLGPGDRVRVTVFGHEDMSGEFEVDGSGIISPPLVRDIKAEGMTVRQVEKVIAERLSPDYLRNPNVSVEVMNYRPFYIFGEVNAPGSYPYVNGMTVVNAVAMAGGYTYRARTNSARITRATDRTKTAEKVDRDTPVLPGDVIEVPERYF
jgi:polysaccharide export outer membrane protein